MEHKRLSLCIIARNEADNIRRCVNSVGNLTDEIIVVDTGSMDETAAIARSLGAKVIAMKWEDDFSQARNLSLEYAQGEWVLCLDCDEEIDSDSLPELENILETEGAEAYFLQIINSTAEGMELTVPGLRLFRNRQEYRFSGYIHEQILPAIVERCDRNRIVQSNIKVHHFGYNQKLANISAKVQRNLRILEKISEEQRDGFYYYNLGTEYLRLNKKPEALGYFIKSASLTHPGQGYGPIMIKRIITLLLELGKYKQAIQYLEHYQGIYSDYSDLVILKGICHFLCGRYSEAGSTIKEYLHLPPSPQWYPVETSFINQTPQQLMEIAAQHAIIKDYPSLSVCIIGKNETNLATCIKSVNEIASQIIYVDTGSCDQSREFAYELGAEVYAVAWEFDYAAVRNYALNQANSEWILVLDADEVLLESSVNAVVRSIKSGSSTVYLAKIHTPLDQNQSAQNWQTTSSIRLFRKGVRYRGVLAEEMFYEENDDELKAEPTADLEIMHLHFQSPSKQIAEKQQIWMETILRQWTEALPLKYYLLGREAFYSQQPQKAVEYLGRYFQADMRDDSTAYYYYVLSLINTGQYQNAITVAEEARQAFPDYTDIVYLQGIAYGMSGRLKDAEIMLLECLKWGDAAWHRYLLSPGTGSYKALLSLGTLYAQQGRVKEAVNTFVQAALIPAGSEQAVAHLTALQSGIGVPIDILFKSQGIFNLRNVLIAAQTFARMGERLKSWEYLKIAGDLFNGEKEYLERTIGVAEALLFNVKNQLIQSTPNHPVLKYL